ncbi:MAG TPA: class A beta-lactamase-related serine hydrolase [bacterium]|nr:class A beta-lactamase-related serine hydrolase [bacterium]
MKRILIFALIFLLVCSTGFAQELTVLENSAVAEKLRLFEIWTQSQMDYYNLPGLAIGIVYDQQMVWQKGFGYADIEKKTAMTAQTIFRIASISKLFTSTAIMQLRDAGKLRLDDPITKYLPWFQIRHRFPDAPEITVWHILTHSSGLPREAAFPYWTDHQFPSLEQIKEKLVEQETIFPSETKWKYSNLAMALLGEIVEAASGIDYESYIRKNILVPLQMSSTSVYLAADQRKALATGYGIRLPDGTRKIMPFTDAKALTPAANFSSTIEDLAKFVALQFTEYNQISGRQILKASTLKEMQRVHWLRPSWTSGWGLGFSIRKYEKRTLVGHGGWVGGYRSQIYFCPKDKIGVIVFCNGEDGSPAKFALKVFDMVVAELLNVLKDEPIAEEFDPGWEKFVGRYQDPWNWVEEVLIVNDKLMLYGFSYPPDENPEAALVELTPEAENTFRMTGANGNGEKVVFELDEQGNVLWIKKGENYLYPVKIGQH